MTTAFEQEQKMHAMIRTMFGFIRDSFVKQVYEMYGADILKTGNDCTYKEVCARWHVLIEIYRKSGEDIQEYVDWIQLAFMNGEDLDKDELWLMSMRLLIPDQFIEKIEHTGFTQVPRGAIMDQSPLRYSEEKKQPKAIFRREA